MPPSAANRQGCYLYGVIDSPTDQEFGPVGIDGGSVTAVSDGTFAAVVSPVPNGKIRPERRKLTAHHEVLKHLRGRFTVLPMAFGLIADGPDAVRRVLALNRDAFAAQCARVAGKVEMGLHVFWDVPNIFEYFVGIDPELRTLRDEMFHGGRQPSQDDKIELGRAFDRLLAEQRQAHTQKVSAVLAKSCVEFHESAPKSEREVMNLACLIPDTGQKAFEESVFEAAQLFDNNFAFDFNGPWPPHNFVDVTLQMG